MPSPGIDLVLTPAVVAGIVTFLLTQRNDGLRSRKDYHTKASDGARDAVRDATELAAEYFSNSVADRTATQEAMMIIADRDIAVAIPRLLTNATGDNYASLVEAVDNGLIDFLALLTGGSFQQRDQAQVIIEEDADHIRRLAVSSAKLREGLIALRDEQLVRSVMGHALWRHSVPLRSWLSDQRGIYTDTFR